MTTAPVRRPSEGEALRPVVEIAPEEVQQAIMLALRAAFGMERDELVVASARLLGFRSTGATISASIELQIEKIIGAPAIDRTRWRAGAGRKLKTPEFAALGLFHTAT